MSQKQRNGPPPRAGRLNSQVAATATVTLIVPSATRERPDAPRTYRLEDLPERIRAQIELSPDSGCWLARRADRDGYGRIGSEGAHRVVWKLLVGQIPDRMELDHREDWGCASRACCYPGHLKVATHRENSLRSTSFVAINAAKEVCDNGHPFDLFNTYWRPNGHRDCRACIRGRVAKYQRRVRAERHEQAADLPRAA